MSRLRESTSRLRTYLGVEFRLYVVVVVASIAILYGMFGIGQANLHAPLVYGGDAAFTGAMIKSGLAGGSFFVNAELGAPGEMNLLDYPSTDGANYLILRAIGLVTHNWAAVLNLFFLVGFPMAAAAALFAFRRLGLGRWFAASLAVLFAFTPYHLMRGENHLFLASIWVVPLACLLVVEATAGRSPFLARDEQGKLRLALRTRSSLVAAMMLLVIGSSGVYYAYFTMCFVVLAALISWWRGRDLAHLAGGAVSVGALTTSVLLSVFPFVAYRLSAGPNPGAVERGLSGIEVYALRITQMMLPIPGHRIPALASMTDLYGQLMRGTFGPVVINENWTAAIGAVAAVGFLILIVAVLRGSRDSDGGNGDRLWAAGSLAVAGVLVATASGFGTFIGIVMPQIRAYNRISIFLAFLALFGAGIALQRLLGRLSPARLRFVLPIVALALLAVGLYDQTGPVSIGAYKDTAAAYAKDRRFVRAVEKTLPPGSAILQLPYVPFPESAPVNKMADYEHFRAYLQSTDLKWSYGAVKGRPDAVAIESLSALPVAQLVAKAKSAGYSGIWIDRFGYADDGVALVRDIAGQVNAQPMESANGRYAVFTLR